jgi:hypothetical protein
MEYQPPQISTRLAIDPCSVGQVRKCAVLRFLLGAARLGTDAPTGCKPSNPAKAVLEGNVRRL